MEKYCRDDRRNAPKGAQRARRLADARGESNTARGKPDPIRRADRRNAPKGAQRARRLADARGESNTVRGKPELGMWVGFVN